MKPKFYITTPIYYPSGAPHIGHAYTTIACDVLARWKRLDGYDVFYLTGTDEHGLKMQQAAVAAGMAPLAYADQLSAQFRAMTARMGISNDDFIRTTEARHRLACEELWRRLEMAGDIYLGTYEGWYAVRDEAYYDEAELITLDDGSKIAPSGAPVEWLTQPSYFFHLSAWQQRLLDWYEANPDCVAPATRRNEVISFVRAGLNDLSISRTSFHWGIPVPGDPNHVMYVWLDALANYITAAGFPDPSSPRWSFWPADVHMVGKDILRFHAVYWPAFLMSAGIAPPKRIYAHGWWTAGGEKMSKSLGNVIDPFELAETFGLDALRFYLMREIPFGNDGVYHRRALINRLNTELANDLGNLAQRSLVLLARNCGGRLPGHGAGTADDAAMLGAAEALPARMRETLDRQAIGDALEEVWKVIRAANAYIDHQAPWVLRRTDPPRMEVVLRVLVDTLRVVATVLQPFMPGSMAKVLDQLAVPAEARAVADLAVPLAAGTALPEPVGVFPRFVETAA
jgi:methionyl-tRNA synthetase